MRLGQSSLHSAWPRDMVISVDRCPAHLSLLLFVREAWRLDGIEEVPALAAPPDTGDSELPRSPDADEWEERWKSAWARAMHWYEIEDTKHIHPTSELMKTQSLPGRKLHPAIPPSWSDEYGFKGLDKSAFVDWFTKVRDVRMPVEPSQERISLAALIEAWNTGLETILTLPFRGHFAKRLTPRHLLISDPPTPIRFNSVKHCGVLRGSSGRRVRRSRWRPRSPGCAVGCPRPSSGFAGPVKAPPWALPERWCSPSPRAQM